jgi:hypothetical protein
MQKELSRDFGDNGKLVSLGDWIAFKESLLPCVCSSGEAELAVSSGKVHLLIAGPGADPSLLELCRSLNIPVISTEDSKGAVNIFRQARERAGAGSQPSFTPDPNLTEEAEVIVSFDQLARLWKKEASSKVALIGGADQLQHSLGWIPGELAFSLRGKKYGVAGWGDAALWMMKRGLASSEQTSPVRILDDREGPMLAVKSLAASGRLKDLKGVCFTGLKSCRDLAVALGLAALGVRVCVAVPLPLWGSEAVRKLLEEKLADQGGSLTYFDHPAHAQEILDWFLKN